MCLGQISRAGPSCSALWVVHTRPSLAVGDEQRQGDGRTKEIFVQSVQANFPIEERTFPSQFSVLV